MVKFINVDGKRFLSEELLIKAMVTNTVQYTECTDVSVSETEGVMVDNYNYLIQRLCQEGIPAELKKNFHDTYITERFIKRTLGD